MVRFIFIPSRPSSGAQRAAAFCPPEVIKSPPPTPTASFLPSSRHSWPCRCISVNLAVGPISRPGLRRVNVTRESRSERGSRGGGSAGISAADKTIYTLSHIAFHLAPPSSAFGRRHFCFPPSERCRLRPVRPHRHLPSAGRVETRLTQQRDKSIICPNCAQIEHENKLRPLLRIRRNTEAREENVI